MQSKFQSRFHSRFHFVQNVLLISMPEDQKYSLGDLQSLANQEIQEIVHNKDKYKVRDDDLDFDVLIRSGSKLYYFSYDSEGTFKELNKTIEIGEGFFAFRGNPTDQHYSNISIGTEKFYLETYANADSLNFKNIEEISKFIQENYPDHFKLWELEKEALDSESVQHHIRTLFNACQHMYIMRRESDNQIVAMRGLTVTPARDLGFRSIAVTKADYRDKGLAATIFQQMTNQYPNAVFAGYIANDILLEKLSLKDRVQPNENNIPKATEINLKNVVSHKKEQTIENLTERGFQVSRGK